MTTPSHDDATNDGHSKPHNFASHDRFTGGIPAPALRILCLHDEGSNAGELSDQLEVLGERLYEKHMIDLVYINSPLLIQKEGEHSDDASLPPHAASSPKRTWWETQIDENGKKFIGLDASLLLLRQVWNSMPFWGVLAVGQGAAAAAFLPLLPVTPPPQFMIFLQGETLLEEAELLIGRSNNMPCLHLMASDPSDSSKRLFAQFGGQVFTGASRKFTSKTLNTIGKFLLKHKNLLRTNDSDARNILVLQNHLYLAEQAAANAVAERIAMDPPKALMAVISPQNVGGWSGGKRRAFGEEGGGAPCPSEFLLKRGKRTTDQNGPTRAHPSHSQNSKSPLSPKSNQDGDDDEELLSSV